MVWDIPSENKLLSIFRKSAGTTQLIILTEIKRVNFTCIHTELNQNTKIVHVSAHGPFPGKTGKVGERP